MGLRTLGGLQLIRTVERMGGAVYTEDLVAKQVNTIYLSLY